MAKQAKKKDNKTVYYITFRGKRVLPFILAPSKNGMVINFGIKEFENIHLTVLDKDGRISWHVKDETKFGDKPPRFGGYEPEKIKKFVEKRTKKWIKEYHGNQKAWQMTDKLLQKAFEYFPKVADDGVVEFPVEFRRLEIIPDFRNKEHWKRVKIRSLLGQGFSFTIIIDEGKYKWVEPISENLMYCYTDEQLKRFQDDYFKHMGFDDYFDYLANRLGDKMKSELKRRFEI